MKWDRLVEILSISSNTAKQDKGWAELDRSICVEKSLTHGGSVAADTSQIIAYARMKKQQSIPLNRSIHHHLFILAGDEVHKNSTRPQAIAFSTCRKQKAQLPSSPVTPLPKLSLVSLPRADKMEGLLGPVIHNGHPRVSPAA